MHTILVWSNTNVYTVGLTNALAEDSIYNIVYRHDVHKYPYVDLVICIQEKVNDPILGFSDYLTAGRPKKERLLVLFGQSAAEKGFNTLALMRVGTHKYHAIYMGVSPEVLRDVVQKMVAKRQPAKDTLKVLRSPQFTSLEKKILGVLSQHHVSNADVATRLNMPLKSIQNALRRARVRFKCSNTSSLLSWYYSLHQPQKI